MEKEKESEIINRAWALFERLGIHEIKMLPGESLLDCAERFLSENSDDDEGIDNNSIIL